MKQKQSQPKRFGSYPCVGATSVYACRPMRFLKNSGYVACHSCSLLFDDFGAESLNGTASNGSHHPGMVKCLLSPIASKSFSPQNGHVIMQHTVEFWLPFPPSTNRLWRSVRGRVVLSPDYKDWKQRAVESVTFLQQLGKQPVCGVHELELYLSTVHRSKRGDADNRLKAVLDIVAKLKFIVDDK